MTKEYIKFVRSIHNKLSEKYPNKNKILYANGISLYSKFRVLILVKETSKSPFRCNIIIHDDNDKNKSIGIVKTYKKRTVIKIVDFLVD